MCVFRPADLAEFQSHFDLPSEPVTKVVGPNDASNPGDEASLDIQYITGVAVRTVLIGCWKAGGLVRMLLWVVLLRFCLR